MIKLPDKAILDGFADLLQMEFAINQDTGTIRGSQSTVVAIGSLKLPFTLNAAAISLFESGSCAMLLVGPGAFGMIVAWDETEGCWKSYVIAMTTISKPRSFFAGGINGRLAGISELEQMIEGWCRAKFWVADVNDEDGWQPFDCSLDDSTEASD